MEDIKGTGGNVTVGTTGTISSLITRELDQISSAPRQPVSSSMKPRISSVRGSTTPKGLQPIKSQDEASSSNSSRSSNIIDHRSLGIGPKTTLNRKHTHQIPMLGSHNFQLDSSPIRKKNDRKKKTNIVEVVDIKCGNADKAWATPITNSLKKLGFSKLSDSII